jgi:ABC-type transport system involved in multi-copper enzyme maturation permease subunit
MASTVRLPNVRFRLAHEPNPVLVKELRARFRGPRAFAALTSFLLVLTLFAWYAYYQAAQNYGYSGMGVNQAAGAEIGRAILMVVTFIEALFLAFIAPSLTADSISGEVERQTWDLLKSTPLSGWSILLGKVGAAFGYVLLLAFSALPVMSLAFVFGGASLSGVLQTQVSMMATGVMYLAIGAFWSSFAKRTARAAILSYGTVGILLLLPITVPILFQLLGSLGGISFYDWNSSPRWWMISLTVSPPVEAFIREQNQWGSSSALGGTLSWLAIIAGRLLLAAGLLLVAGSRIRRMARWGWAMLALVGLALCGWFLVIGLWSSVFGRGVVP